MKYAGFIWLIELTELIKLIAQPEISIGHSEKKAQALLLIFNLQFSIFNSKWIAS